MLIRNADDDYDHIHDSDCIDGDDGSDYAGSSIAQRLTTLGLGAVTGRGERAVFDGEEEHTLKHLCEKSNPKP
ncbi:hypothetical protein VNO78_08831 [Psophocarpus tetragonolobus]|uniref:Uncharacterized protein n=1 Tax=Psophocarpus tetragonolobus TaxID=3891 RepID=A0AAN9XTQ4_PSOTE